MVYIGCIGLRVWVWETIWGSIRGSLKGSVLVLKGFCRFVGLRFWVFRCFKV